MLNSIYETLHMLHIDLFAPMSIGRLGGNKYTLVVVDEYIRYTWVIFLKAKSDAPEEIINLIKREELLKS